MQKPNIGELWTYLYHKDEMVDGPYIIVIDGVIETNKQIYVKFSFIDTWEEDEMGWCIFEKYCTKLNDGI